MKNQAQDVKSHIIDLLNDGVGVGEASELHDRLLNEDYFIIGSERSSEWLASSIFEAIAKICKYEKSNFGKVGTDFSDPERVANVLAYILGEEILSESDTLRDLWDGELTEADLMTIAREIS